MRFAPEDPRKSKERRSPMATLRLGGGLSQPEDQGSTSIERWITAGTIGLLFSARLACVTPSVQAETAHLLTDRGARNVQIIESARNSHSSLATALVRQCAPRARGDGPVRGEHHHTPTSCSPRTRGWSPIGYVRAVIAKVLPAHAGMVPTRPTSPNTASRAPRARGDGPGRGECPSTSGECSPRTRGWS